MHVCSTCVAVRLAQTWPGAGCDVVLRLNLHDRFSVIKHVDHLEVILKIPVNVCIL